MQEFTLHGVDTNNLRLTPHIQTVSGYYINFLDFTNNVYSIFDIAHHLSHLCRFVGATRRFYSVAQHSVWCSHRVPPHLAMLALMHDSQEAYMGDCSTPLKQLLTNFQVIENALQVDIFKAYGIDCSEYTEVKGADHMALRCEQFHFLPGFVVEEEVEEFLKKENISPLNFIEARVLFLDRYRELGGKFDLQQHEKYLSQLNGGLNHV